MAWSSAALEGVEPSVAILLVLRRKRRPVTEPVEPGVLVAGVAMGFAGLLNVGQVDAGLSKGVEAAETALAASRPAFGAEGFPKASAKRVCVSRKTC